MTAPPLSPAQKVRKAATDAYWLFHPGQAAALLIAAADQPYAVPSQLGGERYRDFRAGVEAERARIAAIAAELEAQ